MSTETAFFQEALPWARTAHAQTGVLTSVILAQWAAETGYGGPDWSVDHNPGNVGSFTGQPVNSFPTLAAGVQAYIQTMKLGYYAGVRSAVGYVAQCVALGNSPWAAAHYNDGNGPGSLLVAIVNQYNLTQYDSTPIPEVPTMTNGEFVRWVYYLILTRAVDPSGYSANMAWLNGGGSREQVMENLTDSAEGQDVAGRRRKLLGYTT